MQLLSLIAPVLAFVCPAVACSLKEKTELTGLESDVWDKILREDTSFFPLHKALCLEGVEEEEEREKEEAQRRMDRLAADVASIKQVRAVPSRLTRTCWIVSPCCCVL